MQSSENINTKSNISLLNNKELKPHFSILNQNPRSLKNSNISKNSSNSSGMSKLPKFVPLSKRKFMQFSTLFEEKKKKVINYCLNYLVH